MSHEKKLTHDNISKISKIFLKGNYSTPLPHLQNLEIIEMGKIWCQKNSTVTEIGSSHPLPPIQSSSSNLMSTYCFVYSVQNVACSDEN